MDVKKSYEELLVVLIDLYIVDFDEEEDKELANLIHGCSNNPIPRINDLKERGNYLFKQNQFINAAHLYEQAIKLLCLSGPVARNDELLCWNLAISLSLNLAACALKLQLYNEARASCSLVLNFEPLNVKALYRRAMALLKLSLLQEAYDDLKAGLDCDPNNKDIIREFKLVEEKLLMNSNGKRNSNNERSNVGDKKSRISPRADDTRCLQSNTSGLENASVTPLIERESSSPKPKPGKPLEELSYNKEMCNEMVKEMDVSDDDNKVEFYKKKGGVSRLRIPLAVYQKIQKGEEVEYYNSSSQSYMKVRVFHPKSSNVEDGHKVDEVGFIYHSEMEVVSESLANVECMVEDFAIAKSDEVIATAFEVEKNEGNNREFSLVSKPTSDVCSARFQSLFEFNSPTKVQEYTPRKLPTFERIGNVGFPNKFPNVRPTVMLDPSSRTRLRVLRFRATRTAFIARENKNAYSSFRFSSYWKTFVFCPRPQDVSLYYSAHKPIGTKRKSTIVADLMYPCLIPAKKLCMGLGQVSSSLVCLISMSYNNVVGSIDRVDKCDSESPETTV